MLDDARSLMWEQLVEELDEEALDTTIQRTVQEKVTSLYDNRETLVKQNE